MKKTERNLLLAISLLLVLLFVISSTDLVLSEKKNEVYVLSVLVDDDSSKSWHNFRMGIDKAAAKWNADVSFVTLYDKGSLSQQKQLLERELQNGAQAIILSPADSVEMAKAVDNLPVNIPLIAIGAGVDSPRVRSVITAEPGVMGAELGSRIFTAHKSKGFSQIVEVSYRENRTDTALFSRSLHRALPDGIPVRQVGLYSREDLDKFMVELAQIKTPTAIVATDASTLLTVSERMAEREQKNLSLYGAGWSEGLLRHIESGLISYVGVYSDYDLGYLSVETAVKALTGERIKKEYKVAQALIAGPKIHDKSYEMMLFPIV